MRLLVALALTLQFAPIHAKAQQRARSDEAVVRALIPVLVSLLDSIRPRAIAGTTAWRIDAESVQRPLRRRLRDVILAEAHGRVATAADTLMHVLEVFPVELSGDSAQVQVDHGMLWCEGGWPAASGTTYYYVFDRAGRAWHYRHRRPYISYDPPPPPAPGAKAPGCARAARH